MVKNSTERYDDMHNSFTEDRKAHFKNIKTKQEMKEEFMSWIHGGTSRLTRSEFKTLKQYKEFQSKQGYSYKDISFMRNGKQQNRRIDEETGRFIKWKEPTKRKQAKLD